MQRLVNDSLGEHEPHSPEAPTRALQRRSDAPVPLQPAAQPPDRPFSRPKPRLTAETTGGRKGCRALTYDLSLIPCPLALPASQANVISGCQAPFRTPCPRREAATSGCWLVAKRAAYSHSLVPLRGVKRCQAPLRSSNSRFMSSLTCFRRSPTPLATKGLPLST